jgi:hypothetical protein
MATQYIEFEAPSGLTLTVTLHAEGNDTIAYTASAVVEQTNRKGIYRATFASVAGSWYQLVAKVGSTGVAIWWGYAQDTAQTFVFGTTVRQVDGYATSDISNRIASDIDNDLNGWDIAVANIATVASNRTWDNGFNPTRTITGGTISTVSDKTGYSLANASITSSTFAAGAINAASIAAAALNGKGDWNIGKTGYSLTATTGLGNQTANITGNLSGSVGSVTGAVTVGTINSNVITAASIAAAALNGKGDWNIGKTGYSLSNGSIAAATFAAGAIDANAIATDALGALELAAGAASEIATAVRTELTTELARIDVATSTRLATAGYTAPANSDITAIKAKTDQLTFTVAGQVDANALSGGGGLDAAGVRSAIGLASANLDTQLTAIDDYLDTEVSAIKAKTDQLTFTVANRVDTQVYGVNTNAITSGSVDATAASEIATAVRTELATELGRVDVAVSSRLATAGYTAPDNASIADIETKVDTLLGRITANLFTGITYLRNWLGALAGKNTDLATRAEINATVAGATYNETTDSLEAITSVSGLNEVDANVVAINGQPVSAGQLRLNVINTNVLKNSVLTLVRKDTYSVDNGNPIDFVSDDLPDMTTATGATLTIMSKARVTLLTKSGTVSEVAKRIRFELTEANTTLVVANDNRYDVVITFATGHVTVFSGVNVILDDWS